MVVGLCNKCLFNFLKTGKLFRRAARPFYIPASNTGQHLSVPGAFRPLTFHVYGYVRCRVGRFSFRLFWFIVLHFPFSLSSCGLLEIFFFSDFILVYLIVAFKSICL